MDKSINVLQEIYENINRLYFETRRHDFIIYMREDIYYELRGNLFDLSGKVPLYTHEFGENGTISGSPVYVVVHDTLKNEHPPYRIT